jgi:hypothetical protein
MKRLAIILALAALVSGCELSNNPLLVSGAFVNATFRVDQEGLPPNTPVGSATSVRLADVLADASEIADSVKIYNITVTIDSVTGATSASSPLSATAGIDGRELFRLTDVPLSALGREHSIFDTTVTGCTFTASGVQYLVQALRQSPPPTVTVGVLAHSSSSALHFTLRVKIYTQVYTTP